jgi:DnaJ-domain-containing protein 1
MLWRLRRMVRRRRGHRPEEDVFERFSERFGGSVSRERDPRQEAKEDPQRERPRNTPPPTPLAPPSSLSPALEVLGLGAGASPAEIVAAYRRLARTYHPDKVAGEPQEVREFFERRMKEINAAYSELKRSV